MLTIQEICRRLEKKGTGLKEKMTKKAVEELGDAVYPRSLLWKELFRPNVGVSSFEELSSSWKMDRLFITWNLNRRFRVFKLL